MSCWSGSGFGGVRFWLWGVDDRLRSISRATGVGGAGSAFALENAILARKVIRVARRLPVMARIGLSAAGPRGMSGSVVVLPLSGVRGGLGFRGCVGGCDPAA